MNALSSNEDKVTSANFAHRLIPLFLVTTILPMVTSLASENLFVILIKLILSDNPESNYFYNYIRANTTLFGGERIDAQKTQLTDISKKTENLFRKLLRLNNTKQRYMTFNITSEIKYANLSPFMLINAPEIDYDVLTLTTVMYLKDKKRAERANNRCRCETAFTLTILFIKKSPALSQSAVTATVIWQ